MEMVTTKKQEPVENKQHLQTWSSLMHLTEGLPHDLTYSLSPTELREKLLAILSHSHFRGFFLLFFFFFDSLWPRSQWTEVCNFFSSHYGQISQNQDLDPRNFPSHSLSNGGNPKFKTRISDFQEGHKI